MTAGASSAQSSHLSLAQYVIRDLFPTNEVHLIFGPSFVGKTTLLFQIIEEWRNARDVFGYHSHPAPFCYIECQNPKTRVWTKMKHLGLDPAQIPNFSLLDECTNPIDFNIETVVNQAHKRIGDTLRVLFVDGLSLLCSGKITEQRASSEFLLKLAQICRQHRLTIIGTMTSVKSRDGSSYASALERLPGSGVWSSMTGNKVIVEPVEMRDLTNTQRTLTLLIRERIPRIVYGKFLPNGLLDFADILDATGMDAWLQTQEPSTILSTSQLTDVARLNKVPRMTLYRWLDNQDRLGTLRRIRKGKYLVSPVYSA